MKQHAAVWSVSRKGNEITVTCSIMLGDTVHRHNVVVDATSRPEPHAKPFGAMDDEEIIEAEEHSFEPWVAKIIALEQARVRANR